MTSKDLRKWRLRMTVQKQITELMKIDVDLLTFVERGK